ncbi:MAG TPA: hypothetical protein PLF59_08235 [Cyclobacteriaceae bacterium]|nr:hypothetical protein [Cyclobacteriaceae bacterium]
MADKNDFARLIIDGGDTTAIILAGQALSAVFNTGGAAIRGIITPSNWTPCNISFYTCKTPDFLVPKLKTNVDGSPFSVPTVADQDLPLLAYLFDYNGYIKVMCSINQASQAILDFCLAPIYKGIR